jgi:hypothetical protein
MHRVTSTSVVFTTVAFGTVALVRVAEDGCIMTFP